MRRASRVGASCGRLGLLPAVGTLGSGQLGLNPLSPSLLSSITAPRRLVGVNRTGYLRENTFLSQGIVPTRELATNASDKGVSRAKPLEQWSVKEVQQWFKTSEYQEYADRFAKLTGKQLAKLSEKQFLRRCPEQGDAIYNDLQALREPAVQDPFLFLQALPEMSQWTVPSRIGRIQPPTRTEFPYQKEDLMGVVKTLWEQVVLPNWRAFRKSEIKDRKAWSLAFIHGISGVGKTRLDLELLNLLLEYASRPEFAGDAEIQELKEYLSLGKTVVLDLRHNGSALLPQETEWPAESILGLRLACEYWFPHIAYRDVFGTVRALSLRQPRVLELFWLSSVFKAIAVHPGSPTPNDPSPRIPKLLHIAIDEIQTAFDSEVAYQGQAKKKKFEPLSLALGRALMQGITANAHFFVLGTLSGTAVRHPKEVLDPTDYSSVSVLLPHLSFEATRRVVESFWFKPRPGREVAVTGKDWLAKGLPFERLLATVGGHPRALEVLKQVLDTYDSPPESLNLDRMCKMLADLVAQKFNLDSWGKQGSGAFGLLLALSGIPVRASLVVSSPQAAERVTVSDLERAGLVQLRSPPKCSGDDPLWADIWELRKGKYVVMEVPFVLAQAALVALSSTLSDRELEAYMRGTTLLENFYLDPGGFEKAVLQHRVMRHNVASQFALRQGRDHIPARDLFCGTICAPAFTKLRFKPRTERPVYVAAPTAGVWCQKADLLNEKEIPTIIPLQDGTKIDMHRTSPYAILLSGNNPFDTMQNEQVLSNASGQGKAAMTRKAIVYTDAKFGLIGTRDVLNEKDDIAPLLLKRLQLAHKLKDFMHILVITSNKPARQRGGRPHTAQTLLRVPDDAPASQRQVPDGVDPLTCIVSASDDGLAWALSPTFSSLLTLPHDVSKPVVNEEED